MLETNSKCCIYLVTTSNIQQCSLSGAYREIFDLCNFRKVKEGRTEKGTFFGTSRNILGCIKTHNYLNFPKIPDCSSSAGV